MAQKSRYANKQPNKYSNCYSFRPAALSKESVVDAQNKTKCASARRVINCVKDHSGDIFMLAVCL